MQVCFILKDSQEDHFSVCSHQSNHLYSHKRILVYCYLASVLFRLTMNKSFKETETIKKMKLIFKTFLILYHSENYIKKRS